MISRQGLKSPQGDMAHATHNMKKEYTCQFPCDKSPRNLTRERMAYLLRASRSRRGRGNTWHTASGYYIRDAQLTITRKLASH